MKKIIILLLITLNLSSCSFLRPHKIDIEQGNIITQYEINKLRKGMTKSQVKQVMGTPMIANIFNENRSDYVYTFQAGGKEMQIKRLICIFRNDILVDIITH